MHRLTLIALAIAAPQPLLAEPGERAPRGRVAASLPCAPGFIAMAWQKAPGRARPDRVAPPAPRRDPPRRPPCLRLAST